MQNDIHHPLVVPIPIHSQVTFPMKTLNQGKQSAEVAIWPKGLHTQYTNEILQYIQASQT